MCWQRLLAKKSGECPWLLRATPVIEEGEANMPYLQILETEHFLPMEKLLNAGPLPGAEGTP